MPKFNLVLSTLLLGAVVSSVPTQASQTTEALSNLSRSSKNVVQVSFGKDNASPVPNPPNGSRGPCTIAPLDLKTNTEVWSDRPLFVWQGPLGQIEVREQGSTKALWSQTLEPGVARLQYAGEPLQPGRVYNWVLFDLENNVTSVITFKVMDAQAREQVNIQLQNLEQELKSKRATAEESAIRRAQFFARRRLWSDAWREAFSAGDPMKVIGTIPQSPPTPLCM